MKLTTSIWISMTILLVALVSPIQTVAQERTHYRLIDLGTFGGPQSYVNIPDGYAPVLNDSGMVAGTADTSTPDPYPSFCFNEDCFVSHGMQSRKGAITDLGTLPGGASSSTNWISANGLIAGVSENGESDPLVPGFPELRAVLWKNGQVSDLGTLPEGGYQSIANAVNSQGVVVGLATNTTVDTDSIFGGYQTKAFRWDSVHGMEDLGTLGGTDAVANLVNERGQIVGESYTDVNPSPYCAQFGLQLTTGAFLWDNGVMKNLGTFGGTCTFATDLNNRGEVVGISSLVGDHSQSAFLWKNDEFHPLPNLLGGDNTSAIALNNGGDVVGWASLAGDQEVHASIWKSGAMNDLGTLEGDACSVASSVNAKGKVVGFSAPCDFSQFHAVIWENGAIADLNTLIPEDATLYLTAPETINDRGEIAGIGVDSNGSQHAFLLIPCSPHDAACQNLAATSSTRVIQIPATRRAHGNQNPVRLLLQSHPSQRRSIRMAHRAGVPPQRQARMLPYRLRVWRFVVEM